MIYAWNRAIAAIYQHQIGRVRDLWATTPPNWLSKEFETSSLEADIRPYGQVDVSDESSDSIAKQFWVYMPGHSFKVEHTIDKLEKQHMLPFHTKRACLAVVDIGCGGATASTAVINTMLKKLTMDTQVLFIGVDTNCCAVQLYDWMMNGYTNVPILRDRIDYHVLTKGMPEALTYIAEGLHQAKIKWGIPSLNDLWVIQSNVVRPLYNTWEKDNDIQESLHLDVARGLIPTDFGEVEARAYEQLLQLTEADRMLILTVATNDIKWRNSSKLFGESVMRTFNAKGHKPSSLHTPLDPDQPFSVSYINPDKSYWRMQRRNYTVKFYADVELIESQRFHADRDWQEVISDDNLRLAWARVRAAMIRESLVDEVGLKLFESNLIHNLEVIRDQLLTYTIRLTDLSRLFYSIPKDENKSRSRALQSVQEEILAVAVIQVLGRNVQELMSRNYGYRLSLPDRTEYLYRPWFRSYGRYRNVVRKTIQGSDENGIALKSDIANFYPSIPQERLLASVLKRFRIEPTSRAAWLLRQLLIRSENDKDDGVLQGALASGFWANLYLLELDEQFSDDYTTASFFRYVDDMVLVIFEAAQQGEVQLYLETHVNKLGLTLSESKTESEELKTELERTKKNADLDTLDQRFRRLMEGLYFTRDEYHVSLRTCQEVEWWHFIRSYQDCLRELAVFVEGSRLSRKVWQYVKNPIFRRDRRYEMPAFDLVTNNQLWAEQFVNANVRWVVEANALRQALSELMRAKWAEWKQLKLANPEELKQSDRNARLKNCQTSINFTLNRLARLGYSEVLAEIEEIYCDYPYVLKSHRIVLEHLVLQGYVTLLESMWGRLQNTNQPGHSHIRALILRFYRRSDAMQNSNVISTLEAISISDKLLTDNDFFAEALMATETLIFSLNYRPDESSGRMFAQQASSVKSRCPQLARNLLILARRTAHDSEQYNDLLRTLLADSYPTDKSLNKLNFSDDVMEPETLRQKYYHSRYPDNAEEFEGDYF